MPDPFGSPMHSDDGSLDWCKYSLFGREQLSPATVSNTVVVSWLWGTAVMQAGLPLAL